MAPRKDNSEAIKRIAEKIRTSSEENLIKNFFSINKFSEGKELYRQAFVDFLEVSKVELESLIQNIPLYKIKTWDGLIIHCLEKPSKAVKYMIEITEVWIIPFIDSLSDEDEE